MQTDLSHTEALLDFIQRCPSSYHTILALTETLRGEGYTALGEQDAWDLKPGGRYYVTRSQSSLIAFRVPQEGLRGFMMTASHSESPAFKLKPDPELIEHGYCKLNVEKYGGMRLESWLDRPLSIAGRVALRTAEGVIAKPIVIDRDLLVIPSLALHLTRGGDPKALNPQIDLLPLFGQYAEPGVLNALLAETLGADSADILDFDLFLFCRGRGTVWGSAGEFISAPRLDDLQCVYAALHGFLTGGNPHTAPLLCVFDNEEVGSSTKQGAKSTFLRDTLKRICFALGYDETMYCRLLDSSLMLSCDNGHALHPNHPEASDPAQRPRLNGGVLLKYNANQRYTTDAVSGALVRQICARAGVPLQVYVNRSDIPGGSTLGNLSSEKVSINTADIGLSQLAMHSAWETAGSADTDYLIRALRVFYNSRIRSDGDGVYALD